MRYATIVVIVLALVSLTSADPILSLQNVPAQYTPGLPFGFDVVLTGATDLASYNVAVVLTADTGALGAGGDAWFLPASAPPAARYVFDGYTDFFLSQLSAGGGDHTLVTSHWNDPDGLLPLDGVNTVAGVNDLVAHVTIATAATLADSLHLSVQAGNLELDTPPGTPIPGFSTLQQDVAAAAAVEVAEVPEPAILLLLLPPAAILHRRRRTSRPSRP